MMLFGSLVYKASTTAQVETEVIMHATIFYPEDVSRLLGFARVPCNFGVSSFPVAFCIF